MKNIFLLEANWSTYLHGTWIIFKGLFARDGVMECSTLWICFFFPKKLYGYVDNGFSQEALMCLHITQLQNQAPSDATLVSILKAHGGLGVVDRLHQTHMEIIEKGFEREILVSNMLVDTYGKFGSTK